MLHMQRCCHERTVLLWQAFVLCTSAMVAVLLARFLIVYVADERDSSYDPKHFLIKAFNFTALHFYTPFFLQLRKHNDI